jgi:hypothetical protein
MNLIKTDRRRRAYPLLEVSEARRPQGPTAESQLLALASEDSEQRGALTEVLLHELFDHVAMRLAEEFLSFWDDSTKEIETLGTLARALDLDVDVAALAVEIEPDVDRFVWTPTARAASLHLLDWLVLNRPGELVEAFDWAKSVVRPPFSYERFRRLTSLSNYETDRVMEIASHAISSWEKLEKGLPLLYLGSYVTLTTESWGSVACDVSDTPGLALVRSTVPIHREDDGTKWTYVIDSPDVRVEPLVSKLEYSGEEEELVLSPGVGKSSLPAAESLHLQLACRWTHHKNDSFLMLIDPNETRVSFSVPKFGARSFAGGVVLQGNLYGDVSNIGPVEAPGSLADRPVSGRAARSFE